jgi:hypothetical protein
MRQPEADGFVFGRGDERFPDAFSPRICGDCHVRHEGLVFLSDLVRDVGQQDEESRALAIDAGDEIDGARPLAAEREKALEGSRRHAIGDRPDPRDAGGGARRAERRDESVVFGPGGPDLDAHGSPFAR